MTYGYLPSGSCISSIDTSGSFIADFMNRPTSTFSQTIDFLENFVRGVFLIWRIGRRRVEWWHQRRYPKSVYCSYRGLDHCQGVLSGSTEKTANVLVNQFHRLKFFCLLRVGQIVCRIVTVCRGLLEHYNLFFTDCDETLAHSEWVMELVYLFWSISVENSGVRGGLFKLVSRFLWFRKTDLGPILANFIPTPDIQKFSIFYLFGGSQYRDITLIPTHWQHWGKDSSQAAPVIISSDLDQASTVHGITWQRSCETFCKQVNIRPPLALVTLIPFALPPGDSPSSYTHCSTLSSLFHSLFWPSDLCKYSLAAWRYPLIRQSCATTTQ